MNFDLTRRAMLGALPALGLAGVAAAQTPLQQPGHRPGHQPGPGERVFQPGEEFTPSLDTWLDLYGRPTTKVMLNGKGPFSFMVDTGSTVTVLAQRHLATVGAPIIGKVTVAGTTGMAETPMARVDLFEAGIAKQKSVHMAVLPDSGVANIDGILGADLFAGRRLRFDIKRKSVRIEESRQPTYVPPKSIMRVRNKMLAEIDGRIGKVPCKLMLDTGAQNCIANLKLSQALLKAHPKLMRLDNVKVFGVTGHVLTGQFIAMPQVETRAFYVEDATAVALDAPIFEQWKLNDEPAMIVGMNLLSRLHSFTLDYGAKSFDAKLFAEMIAGNMIGLG
ncbi:MAG TPA: aspartyl protease family protein [Hyphomonadaceae bacterium]|nr:aspartyl protease family protein [Hyphomonadaceae bacterium]HPN05110.1 aspartyl protease family protein [Hyphomonadaceae bacterium]